MFTQRAIFSSIAYNIKEEETMETVVVRSMCDQCHSACGVLAHVQGGKVVKVEGDPNHPESRGFICMRRSGERARHVPAAFAQA